ncbi:uncharacterized protein PgNI_01077 [Pyricularia grisea]|uniref:Uncharacterized protein n=2 Tax=Pyricularia TaxID=48558 RepID=A0A6P8BKF9_PYRGI|nr:uncharacterized protein PgNI_01077 [Pyricularia grisea]TLD17189.1 hypothetical protein PgNI_01077 [Pyricularia grisea]
MEPLIRAERDAEIILVFANRCGIERDVLYAGTSAVMGIQNGEVNIYGVLGRGTKHLLVVDTDNAPFAKLVRRPGRDTAEGEWDGVTPNAGVEAHDLSLPDYDELDRLLDLNRVADPVSSRPSAPVQLLPVNFPLSACLPEKAKEAVIDGSVEPSKLTKLDGNPTKEKTTNCVIGFNVTGVVPNGLVEIPRADSSTLTPARPRLRILTATSPAPANNPHSSDISARPIIALPHDLVTPPPSGEFPGQEYLTAGQAELLALSDTALYSPEEPVLPSACQSLLDFKPLPLWPHRLSEAKSAFGVSPVRTELTVPTSPAPALEKVPPVEQSPDAESVPQMEVQTPVTAILAPQAVSHGYIPLLLLINVGFEEKH